MRSSMSKKFLWLFSFLLVGSVVYGAVTSDQGIFTTQVITPILQGNSALTIKTPGSNAITFSPNATPAFTLSGAGVANFPNLTASTTPVLDASKNLTSSTVTGTELAFVHNVTSQLSGNTQSATLTTKSMSGASNTFTNIPLSAFTNLGTTTTVLHGNPAGSPTFGAVNLATDTTGVNAIANGGTANGSLSVASGTVFYADGTKIVGLAPGTTGQALKSNGSSAPAWGAVAGSGTKNYLSTYNSNPGNGDFELGSTSGWSIGACGTITSGIPTGSPTFGSGASGNLSLSTITSGSQIAGSFSGVYSSIAATTSGNCLASSAFTIDTQDQVKILAWQFYYKVIAGAALSNWTGTSSNSFGVAIWDVTNSAWIIPQGNFNLIQSSGAGIASGTFQTTASSTQYRFVVYNANATSGAVTLYEDDFQLGPQSMGIISSLTDLAKAPAGLVPSAGFGTPASPSYKMRQVGDHAEITMTFTAGTVGATSAYIALPFTIDATKLPTNAAGTWVGDGTRAAPVAVRGIYSSNDAMYVFYDGSSTDRVFLSQSAGSQVFTKLNVSDFISTSDNVSITFKVPVLGWSSGQTVSGSTNIVGGITATATTSSQNINATTATIIYSAVAQDTASSYNSTTGVYTIPVTGSYSISTQIGTNAYPLGTTSWDSLGIVKNSSTTIFHNNIPGNGGSAARTYAVSGVYPFVAGDTVKAQFATTANVTLDGNASNNTFSISLAPGASQNNNGYVAPTVQTFTTGTAQTYTTPTSPRRPLYLKVRAVAGGGGGAGGNASLNGGAGGNTTFGTSLLSATGGGAGISNASGGAGGAASLGSGPVGAALTGGSGGASTQDSTGSAGGVGGSSAFGGGGFGGGGSALSAGGAGAPNTGAGGGGAGGGNGFGGSGGGAGGYVDAIITSPLTTYTYSVGASGTAGGTGGAGGAGIIIVEEFYQ